MPRAHWEALTADRALVAAAVLAGLVLAGIAVLYFADNSARLPTFLPGDS